MSSVTIADVEDAFLSAQSLTQEWQAEFMANWFRPYTDTALVMKWNQWPPAVHAQLQAMDPVAYGQVAAKVKKITEGLHHG